MGRYFPGTDVQIVQLGSDALGTEADELTADYHARKKHLLNRLDDTTIMRVEVGRERGGIELGCLAVALRYLSLE